MIRPGSAPIRTTSQEARLRVVDAEHGVRAPIEDEILSGRGLLKAGGLSKTPGDVRRNRSGRLQNLELQRRERRQQQQDDDGDTVDRIASRSVGRVLRDPACGGSQTDPP